MVDTFIPDDISLAVCSPSSTTLQSALVAPDSQIMILFMSNFLSRPRKQPFLWMAMCFLGFPSTKMPEIVDDNQGADDYYYA